MKLHEIRRLSKACPIKGVANAVLLELLTHVGEEPVVWPSQDDIGDTIGFSSRAVRRALIALEKAGVVSRTGRRRHGVTEYRIAIDMLEDRSERPVDADGSTAGRSVRTGRSVHIDRTERPAGPDGASYKDKGREKEGKERAGAQPAPDLFPDQNPKADLEPKRRSAPKPKKTACPWPTVDAMLADPEVMRLAVEKGMRNGTVNAQAAQFLAHHDEKGSRFSNWYRAWGVTWCQRWADWGAKQSHAPAPAISPEAAAKRLSGPLLYRVKDYFCERQQLDGTWRRVDNTPADLMQRFSDRTVEFDWTECSPARAAELKAELAAAKGAAA